MFENIDRTPFYQKLSYLDIWGTYLVFIVFIFFALYFKPKKIQITIILIHIFIFYLFHPIIITEDIFPDIRYYLTNIESVRANAQTYTLTEKTYQMIPYALVPIHIESFSSIGLVNLILFIALYFYCKFYKIFDTKTEYFYLLLPSIILYSSIALKEFLVLFITLISFHHEY